MTLRRTTLSTLPALLLLAITAPAPAVPYIPPYSQVINVPTTIPSNGVVAVGQHPTFNSVIPGLVTEGTLESVTNADGVEVAGTASSFMVTLGDGGETQSISLWTPSAPFVEGSYIAIGLDEFTQPNQSGFTAVAPSGGAVPTPSITATLSSAQFPANQLSCGEVFGIGAEMIPLYITTHYTQQPAVQFEFTFAAPDDVQSQHFSRVREPGVLGTQFLPAYFNEGVRNGQLGYVAPQANYCVRGELLSLQTQQIIVSEASCVDDDGRDWSAAVPATSDQIDAQLRSCNNPPPEYFPRYCVVWADAGSPRPECESLTPEELDAARDNPITPGPLPDEPVVNPPVNPPVSPVDPVVDPSIDPKGDPAIDPSDPEQPDPDAVDPVTPDPATPNGIPIGPVQIDPDTMSMAGAGNDPESDGMEVDANGNPISDGEDIKDGELDGNDQNLDGKSASDTGNDGGCSLSAPNGNASWLSSLGFGLLLFGLGRTRRREGRG